MSVLFVIALAGIAGCGVNDSGNTSVTCRALTAAAPGRPAAFGGSVFTIVMENHDRTQIIGNPAAPFISSLAAQGAVAAGYHDSYVHPSEPNYIWMVAGENFGILNDDDPGPNNAISSQSHLADQLELAGLTWKAYEDAMGSPCGLKSQGTYAAKHDPFVYFDDISGWNGQSFQPSARCVAHVVDYTALASDIAAGTVPNYVFITPDMIHDMHDGTIADGDAWLAAEVPKIMASDAFTRGGVLFLVWDEGASQGDQPPFIVVSPNAKPGYVSSADYDTSSFLKTVEAIMGVDSLPCSSQPAGVHAMDDLFTVPLSPTQ